MTNLIPDHDVDHPLEPDEAVRISQALAASRSSNTRRVYASRWRAWEAWCIASNRTPVPALPLEVAAHVTWLSAAGRSMSTINATLAAIRVVHLERGLDDPTAAAGVRQVRAGLSRTLGIAAQKQAHALAPVELRRMLATCDRDGVRGVRDRALLLVGFAGALRRSEISNLDAGDIEKRPTGLALTLRRSKGDQEGRGTVVGVARGAHPESDPVSALNAWLT